MAVFKAEVFWKHPHVSTFLLALTTDEMCNHLNTY